MTREPRFFSLITKMEEIYISMDLEVLHRPNISLSVSLYVCEWDDGVCTGLDICQQMPWNYIWLVCVDLEIEIGWCISVCLCTYESVCR